MNARADDEVLFDFDRRRRTGLDEAVFAQGKTTAQLESILAAAAAKRVPLLLTRLSVEAHAALLPRWSSALDYCPQSRTAFFDWSAPSEPQPGTVAIVVAGSSDAGVAREAARTLTFNGVEPTMFIDVGVAGLWRLTSRIDAISAHPVVIAVAGMDAALPTVLGGLVSALIIAVPTSVGYGVAAGGQTALHSSLASCASGIAVVNIDNGYGAACAALRALHAQGARPRPSMRARADIAGAGS